MQYKSKRGLFGYSVLFSVFSFGILIFSSSAHALTLIPPSFEINVAPGQKIETEVKLFNETPDAVELYTEAVNFTSDGETGNPKYDFSAPVTDLSSWFVVDKGPLALLPGQRLVVPVTINVPADADPGGHYAALFFSNVPPAAQGQDQITIGMKLGVLFLVRVEGEIIEQGSLEAFSLENAQTVFSRLPVDFLLRFQNSGNIHLRPTGTVKMTNMFGKTVGSVDINPGKGATLPKSIRQYAFAWEKGRVNETTGNILTNFFKEFSNEWKNFGFGRYTADLNVTFGLSNDKQATAQLSFWIIPWHIITTCFISLIVLIFIFILLLKRYNAWIIRKAHAKK